ncbi:MAG: glycosyltransferase family 4 protein [Bacteroidota bacterium]|nr:glycosyltransferase family 4 protein [Bacteroidota bacterium]
MKNFLSVVWYRVLPPAYGGQKGIALFNQYLGKKVPLTCLCSHDNVPGKDLSYQVVNVLPVSRFQFWDPLTRKKILARIREQSFSHIIIEHPYHAWIGKYIKKTGTRFIVHAHNIEHLRMKARGKFWWWLVKGTEQRAFALADHILFKTESDQSMAIELFGILPGKCMVVPYGTLEKEQPAAHPETRRDLMRKHEISPDEKIILFAGTLDYEPNARALENILEDVIPPLMKKRFRFRLLICGACPPATLTLLNSLDHVTATGFVPCIEDYLQSADVFINPVLSGSGIQTKNIEAIASGCNVATTAFAANGLPRYLSGTKVFVSNDHDWERFADNIIMAASRPAIVPQQFYDEYNWQNIIDKFLEKADG